MYKTILLPLLLLFTLTSFSQSKANFCEQVSALQALVKEMHYKPKVVNDSLSKGVFSLFINRLDEEKNFFLKTDIKHFKTDELKLDDYVLNEDCSFIDKYIKTLEARINNIQALLEALKNETIDYNGRYTLQYTPEEFYTFYANEDKLKNGLKKRIGYKVISKLLDEHKDINHIRTNFTSLKVEAKQQIIKSELCLLEETLNKSGGIKRFAEEAFLNALVAYNDPNSTFFNNTEKLSYENDLSTSQLSFGVITSKNKSGDIVVVHIVPGSSAFKNGNIEVDDILKSLSTSTKKLDILCVSNKEIEAFTGNEVHYTVTFSIKKKNGTTQDVTLTKSKIKVDENAIRGYLVGVNATIGYIKIPSFYTNYESPNGRGLTADIAKELYKLQKENIEGLVIDLRFNGGGSMQEAIELSGMFIDRGPVSIIKMNTGETFTIRDPKRGSFYKGPLLVLINNYSASASEFFASAMQDYNRAIIVGSATHGKSSAQRIMPLSETKDLGFSKLTIEAFYRVTGKSHQSIGVVPDIKLPSLYNNFNTNEKFESNALPNDTITVSLKHRPLPKQDITQIISNSKKRVSENLDFQNLAENNLTLKKRLFTKGEAYTLTLDNIHSKQKERQAFGERIFNYTTAPSDSISIKNTISTKELLEYNGENKTQNKAILKELSKDIYIKEAHNILTDIINSNN